MNIWHQATINGLLVKKVGVKYNYVHLKQVLQC